MRDGECFGRQNIKKMNSVFKRSPNIENKLRCGTRREGWILTNVLCWVLGWVVSGDKKIHLKMKTMTSSKFLLLGNYVVGNGYAEKRYICGGHYIFFLFWLKLSQLQCLNGKLGWIQMCEHPWGEWKTVARDLGGWDGPLSMRGGFLLWDLCMSAPKYRTEENWAKSLKKNL